MQLKLIPVSLERKNYFFIRIIKSRNSHSPDFGAGCELRRFSFSIPFFRVEPNTAIRFRFEPDFAPLSILRRNQKSFTSCANVSAMTFCV